MNKRILILPLMLLLSIFYVNAISCGFSSPTPASGGRINPNQILNASFDSGGVVDDSGVINVVYYLASASTRNSTAATSGLVRNESNNTGVSNTYSVNTTFAGAYVIEDSTDYTLSCECINASAVVACNSTRTGMIVDRTVPSAPTSVTFSNPVEDAETITATIDRANANRCFIRFGSATTPRNAMVLSGSTCTYTVSKNNPPNYDYQAFVEADDRTNSTLGSVNYITIKAVKSDGGGFLGGASFTYDGSQGGQNILGGSASNPFTGKKDNTMLWVIVGALVFLYFRNKK